MGPLNPGRNARDEYFRRLELVVDNTTNMVVVTNAAREIVWVNAAYSIVTGWTLEEVRGRNPRSFLHGPRTDPRAAARLGAMLRTGEPVRDFEMLNYTKSGKPYWVSLTIQPVRSKLGKITEYVAIQTDITERKRREIERERLLRRIGEAQRIARLGYMEHDLTTGTVHCSAEIFRILDSDRGEGDETYETLMASTHPEDVALVRERYERAVNEGLPYESEHRVLTKAGRVKWVRLAGVLEGWDDGTPALYRIAVQDITEHKKAEQVTREKDLLEQAARTQMELLSRISHELRTPLHAVHGFAEMVERQEAGRLSEGSSAHLRRIRDSSRHLVALVNDILDLTSAQDRELHFDVRPVDCTEVATEVAKLLEPLAVERRIRVEVVPPHAVIVGRADRQRLAQVLVNLVGNAIKYSGEGGRIAVRPRCTGGPLVAIDVQDDGPGIATEHLARLFEPFYRIREGGSAEGSGLGLAIAKSLAVGMGGDISVESTIGEGSTFTVTLPGLQPAELRSNTCAGDERAARRPGAGVVLYVEDNEFNRLLVESYLLDRPDIDLHCASTGAAAMAAARALHPRLILVDMHLPDTTGRDLVRRVLDDPDLRRTPCVAFSADAGEAQVEAAILAGFREYLTKPIGRAEFLATLDRLLSEEPLATWM